MKKKFILNYVPIAPQISNYGEKKKLSILIPRSNYSQVGGGNEQNRFERDILDEISKLPFHASC